jgi:hypothetical protein
MLKPVEAREKHGRKIEKKENILQLQGEGEHRIDLSILETGPGFPDCEKKYRFYRMAE